MDIRVAAWWRPYVTGGVLRKELDGSANEAAWFALEDVAALRTVELVTHAFAMRR